MILNPAPSFNLKLAVDRDVANSSLGVGQTELFWWSQGSAAPRFIYCGIRIIDSFHVDENVASPSESEATGPNSLTTNYLGEREYRQGAS